jgi:hypothetical protein
MPPGTKARVAAGIGRRELVLWLVATLFAHQLLAVPAQSLAQYAEGLQVLLASKSVFYYVAWYAVFRLVVDSSRTELATTGDIGFTLAILALFFLSVRAIPWMATTAVGIYLIARSRSDAALAAAGAVLLALAFNGFWGPHLFDAFAYYLLRVDATIVGTALTASQSGVTWSETVIATASGHSIIVYGPCSSYHNISLGLLCWVALTKLARSRWASGDVWVGLLVCAAVVALNASRLYMMASSAESFTYWHEGTGQHLFAWATTLTVLGISLWGALREARTP